MEEAAIKTQRKEENDAYETNNRNDMLAVFEDALKKGTDDILLLSDAHMILFICYYFQQKFVQLAKTKKSDLKAILPPLLEHHDAATETTMTMVAEMSVGEAAVAYPESCTCESLLAEEV